MAQLVCMPQKVRGFCRLSLIGSFKQRRREQQKINRFILGKQQLCITHPVIITCASRFFAHFFDVTARLRRELPNFTFYGGRELTTTIFFFFCELRYSPLEFIPEKIANIWQIKQLQ